MNCQPSDNELSALGQCGWTLVKLRGVNVTIRRAVTSDVRAIRHLIDTYSVERRLLSKATVAIFESVQEFWVAVGDEGDIVGCGAIHVMWEDLAEIRTVAVDRSVRGQKIGHRIVTELLATATRLGVSRVFCLTFETGFFSSFGFHEIDGAPVPPKVYEELLRSYDEGVAEFLDLERVKPNTLGNTRMLLHLDLP
jgi:amino-acid N-acetyltransferase